MLGTPLERPFLLALDLRRRARIGLLWLRPAVVSRNTSAWLADRRARHEYRHLGEAELLATRTSDTVFVLGSGKSILDIPEERWRAMERFQTLSFSHFARQSPVRADYHVHGEVYEFEQYASWFRENPHYASTIHVVQEGWPAASSNELIGRRLLSRSRPVFRYRRAARAKLTPPSRRFRDGLVHSWNSSISVTNFALLMGWRRVVLVGIDLYDSEYFYLPPGVPRTDGAYVIPTESKFNFAERIVPVYGLWRREAEARGQELLVYNPRSLLASVLDVFEWPSSSKVT